MKILWVHQPGPRPGGAERYLDLLEAGLAARGHVISRVSPSRDDPRAAGESLDRALVAANPDRIHVHRLEDSALERCLARAAPMIRSIHDHRASCPGGNRLRRDGRACIRVAGQPCLLEGLRGKCAGLSRWPHHTWSQVGEWASWAPSLDRERPSIVASTYVRDTLASQGWPSRSLHVAPYPVWSPPSVSRAASQGRDVLIAGRWVQPDKGLDLLLETLTRLPPVTRAVLAGDGPARPWLERRLRERGLAERVELTGWLDFTSLSARLLDAALVVMSSRWPEPSGLSGLEALAHARPVVATDVGGIGEWLHDGEFGFRSPPGDPVALADRIRTLLDDPDLRDRMRAAGREWIRAHRSLDPHLDRIEAIHALAGSPPRVEGHP